MHSIVILELSRLDFSYHSFIHAAIDALVTSYLCFHTWDKTFNCQCFCTYYIIIWKILHKHFNFWPTSCRKQTLKLRNVDHGAYRPEDKNKETFWRGSSIKSSPTIMFLLLLVNLKRRDRKSVVPVNIIFRLVTSFLFETKST